MERAPNRLQRRLAQLERLGPLAGFLRQRILRGAIPFTGTAGLEFRELALDGAVVALRNRRRVQNHIGTVHAIALCNGLEAAMGALAEASIPADKRWIPKGMDIAYTAKADSDDRLGSTHPTVKPVDLMAYLVRLVTRKGGTVLATADVIKDLGSVSRFIEQRGIGLRRKARAAVGRLEPGIAPHLLHGVDARGVSHRIGLFHLVADEDRRRDERQRADA